MPIYTKTGDKGETSIIGGKRISKADLRIEAYGTLDELIAFEGELYNRIGLKGEISTYLQWVISRTMDCASLLASEDNVIKKLPQITDNDVQRVEYIIDVLLEEVPQIDKFTLPIGDSSLSASHICRTICRRAERCVVRLADSGIKIDSNILNFINRLSDFFYALGRHIVHSKKIKEILWSPSDNSNSLF